MKLFGRSIFSVSGLLVLAVVVLSGVAYADAVTRTFKSSSDLEPGWLVALKTDSDDTVEIAPAGRPDRVYGVVIDPKTAALLVKGTGQEVAVATSGRYPMLVSNVNGAIGAGDYLSLSIRDGIAAKATSKQGITIGRAVESFNGGAKSLFTDGEVSIGRIDVELERLPNASVKLGAVVPGPLKGIAESVSGKPLSAIRIYAALAVLLICMIIVTTLLLSGIRSGMVAIGRNPLSRHLVFQGLSQVIVACVAVFIVGVLGIYLLLKL